MYDLLILIIIIVPVCRLQALHLPHGFSDLLPKHRFYSGNVSIIQIFI